MSLEQKKTIHRVETELLPKIAASMTEALGTDIEIAIDWSGTDAMTVQQLVNTEIYI